MKSSSTRRAILPAASIKFRRNGMEVIEHEGDAAAALLATYFSDGDERAQQRSGATGEEPRSAGVKRTAKVRAEREIKPR